MRVHAFDRKQDNMVFMKSMGFPAIDFKVFDGALEEFDGLYTVRTSSIGTSQRYCPRKIGVDYQTALAFCKEQASKGLVVYYYPFLYAIKSGVIRIDNFRNLSVEEVDSDLWDLINNHRCDRRFIKDYTNSLDLVALREDLREFAPGLSKVAARCMLNTDQICICAEYMLGYRTDPSESELVVLELYGYI